MPTNLNDLVNDSITSVMFTPTVNDDSVTSKSYCFNATTYPSFFVYIGNCYDIADVEVEYKTEYIVNVDPTQRDNKGNYKAEKKTIKKPYKTIVRFKNGDTQFALCDSSDEFNLEVGISICLCKQLLGTREYKHEDGTKLYNQLIRSGIKAYKRRVKEEEEMKAEEEAKRIKEASKQRRRIRKAEKKKEKEIEILAEAIRRARYSI